MTALTMQFPTIFIMVRPMSINVSTPRIGSIGIVESCHRAARARRARNTCISQEYEKGRRCDSHDIFPDPNVAVISYTRSIQLIMCSESRAPPMTEKVMDSLVCRSGRRGWLTTSGFRSA
jgi:hypothetical protein